MCDCDSSPSPSSETPSSIRMTKAITDSIKKWTQSCRQRRGGILSMYGLCLNQTEGTETNKTKEKEFVWMSGSRSPVYTLMVL